MKDSDEAIEKRITQLRKGILGLAVMGVLYHQSQYGYSLVRVFSETRSTSIKECTIYPILTRLNRDGLVQSQWVESIEGPPRKYYALTSSGRQVFDMLSQEFDLWVSLIKRKRKVAKQPEQAMKKLVVLKR